MTKKALGRGLDALISGGVVRKPAEVTPSPPVSASPVVSSPSAPAPVPSPQRAVVADGETVHQLPIDKIEPSPLQPRTEFDPEHLQELADSIRQRGVINPLLVRPVSGPGAAVRYELVAGERRWRAAREAGLTVIPAIVRRHSDEEVLEIALIENLQREDLNPIEEARAYEQLISRFRLTQEQIAEKVGRNRATVANALRLLGLPDEVQSWLVNGQLSVGHAKAILALSIPEEQRLIAEKVLRRNMTVRETERLIEQFRGRSKGGARGSKGAPKSAHVQLIEERLQEKLGTYVNLRHGKKKGRIEIEYYGNDDLERLLGIFGVENL